MEIQLHGEVMGEFHSIQERKRSGVVGYRLRSRHGNIGTIKIVNTARKIAAGTRRSGCELGPAKAAATKKMARERFQTAATRHAPTLRRTTITIPETIPPRQNASAGTTPLPTPKYAAPARTISPTKRNASTPAIVCAIPTATRGTVLVPPGTRLARPMEPGSFTRLKNILPHSNCASGLGRGNKTARHPML